MGRRGVEHTHFDFVGIELAGAAVALGIVGSIAAFFWVVRGDSVALHEIARSSGCEAAHLSWFLVGIGHKDRWPIEGILSYG